MTSRAPAPPAKRPAPDRGVAALGAEPSRPAEREAEPPLYARTDVVGAAEALAEAAAMADRRRFEPFVAAAERLARDRRLVVRGPAATRLLLGGAAGEPPPPRLDSFQCDFLGAGAEGHARALADAAFALAPAGLGRHAAAREQAPGLFAVSVDGRDLFTVAEPPAHRGVRAADVVAPSWRPAQFARGADGRPLQLACLGPELQLMCVYAALCDPARAADWGGLLAAEAGLRALLGREIRPKLEAAATGGAPAPAGARGRLLRALAARFLPGPGRVLVGYAASALLAGAAAAPAERLQVVAAGPLAAEAAEAGRIARDVGAAAEWAAPFDPKVPTDPRLRVLTVYLVEGGRRAAVLDLYNAGGHELVPFVRAPARGGRGRRRGRARAASEPAGAAPAAGAAADAAADAAGVRVGTPFVLLRWRLLEIWSMSVLRRLDAVSAEFARRALFEMLADFDAVAAHYEGLLARAADPAVAARLLPLADYAGAREDPLLAAKRAAASRPARFRPPYYAAAASTRDGRGPGPARAGPAPPAELSSEPWPESEA